MGQTRPLFVYFCSYQTQIFQKKTVGFSGIQTRIVGVEGEHADHLTNTTAHLLYSFTSAYLENNPIRQLTRIRDCEFVMNMVTRARSPRHYSLLEIPLDYVTNCPTVHTQSRPLVSTETQVYYELFAPVKMTKNFDGKFNALYPLVGE